MSLWVFPFTACVFKSIPSRVCSRLGTTDGCFPVVAQRVRGVSSSPFRFDSLWPAVVFVLCLGMETGQQALARAGDVTAGILAAMGSGLTMVTLSQAGERAMASRGAVRGIVVTSRLAPLSPAGLQPWRRAQWNQRSHPQSREVSVMRPPPGFNPSSIVLQMGQVLHCPRRRWLQSHTLAQRLPPLHQGKVMEKCVMT